ncbi:hypothetical protein G6M78_01805 [Agrobacterium tumefaciens]|jgi:integrase|uniref:hypothetical protein n=1 Tax=Agrobacterium tumefaciens TaxID=358 RepID=UPI0015722BCC|nr:hypothetical protein [Agrobacterium tumefaciens]NTE53806.1 hypothetical protein [Agrobacterium tumefaciens]NTE70565.1 hypothetical protein [Agrobacterium tumefaciens]
MASLHETFGQHFMRKFLNKPFEDGDRIYTDKNARGLELRVQGKKASWILRYKKMTKTIAYAVVAGDKSESRIVTSAAEITALNSVLRTIIDRDPTLVDPFLAHYFAEHRPDKRDMLKALKDAEQAAAEAAAKASEKAVHDNAWTLQQAVDNFLEKRKRDGKKKAIKDTYAAEVRWVFAREEFAEVINAPITTLNSKIGEDIRDAFERNRGISPAKKAVSRLRAVLRYAYENHRGQSGLEGRDPWWLMLTTDTVIKARKRRPEIDGIAKALALAAYFLDHRLPGRVGVQHGVRDNVFAAFLWIILSGQRQQAGLQLKAANLTPYPGRENDGWFLAQWDEGVQKNGKRFALPVPPRMATALRYYVDKAKHTGSSGWAFPSEDGDDVHVSPSGVRGVLKRLAARDPLMKGKETAVDLLALNGVKYFSPHDLRRAITRTMDDAGIPGGASAVLAHTIEAGKQESDMSSEELAAWVRNRVAAITGDSYGDIQHLDLKSEAMLVWTDAVLDAWNHVRSEGIIVDQNGTLVASELFDPEEEKEAA